MSRATVVGTPSARRGARRALHRSLPSPAQVELGHELAPGARDEPDATRREERPRSGGDAPPSGAGGGRLALGDIVASAWEGLLAAGSAPCPVCGERMARERDGSGGCAGCGAVLT